MTCRPRPACRSTFCYTCSLTLQESQCTFCWIMFAAIIDREAVELSALCTELTVKEIACLGVVGLWLMAKLKSLWLPFSRDVEYITLICSEISPFETCDVKRYHRGRLWSQIWTRTLFSASSLPCLLYCTFMYVFYSMITLRFPCFKLIRPCLYFITLDKTLTSI